MTRYSFGMTPWIGAFGSPQITEPMETHKGAPMDKDARRWFNTNRTTSEALRFACSYFLTTGWPPEALDDFLEAIKPNAGWMEEWTPAQGAIHREQRLRYRSGKPNHTVRNAEEYGIAWGELREGRWHAKSR